MDTIYASAGNARINSLVVTYATLLDTKTVRNESKPQRYFDSLCLVIGNNTKNKNAAFLLLQYDYARMNFISAQFYLIRTY